MVERMNSGRGSLSDIEVRSSVQQSLEQSTASFKKSLREARRQIHTISAQELQGRIAALETMLKEARETNFHQSWKLLAASTQMLASSEADYTVRERLFHASWLLTASSAFATMLAKMATGQLKHGFIAGAISSITAGIGAWSGLIDFSKPLQDVYNERIAKLETLVRDMRKALAKRQDRDVQ